MLTTFPQKTFVQVGRVSVAQVQGLRRTEGLCLPGGFLFQFCFRKQRNLKGSCLLTKVSQIEGQLLPEAALELTKLEEDALLQVLWISKTPFIESQVFLCLRCTEKDDGRDGLGEDIFLTRKPCLIPRLQVCRQLHPALLDWCLNKLCFIIFILNA